MSGKSPKGHSAGRPVRGGGGRGRGRGCGNHYSGNNTTTTKPKGLCSALTHHVFDYGQKGAADQMRMTWEKIVHHVGTIYGHDVSNELQNKKTVPVPKPEYSLLILEKHQDRIDRYKIQEQRFILARTNKKRSLEAELADGDVEAEMLLAVLDQEIDEAAYLVSTELPIKLTEEERTEHDNNWRTYRERNLRLEKQ